MSLSRDPVDTLNGSVVQKEVDLKLWTPSLPMAWTRSYNSLLTATSCGVGNGWTHSFNWRLERDFTNNWVTVWTGDGSSRRFYYDGQPSPCWRATRDIAWPVFQMSNGTYRLDIPAESQWFFSSNGVLTAIADLSGNTITLSYSGNYPSHRLVRVEHDNGQFFSFSYAGGQLSRIDTPSASLYATYQYDVPGNLIAASVHTSNRVYVTEYAYGAHGLTQRVNAAGVVSSYRYKENTTGFDAGYCTNMVMGADGYRHTIEYKTNIWVSSGYWEEDPYDWWNVYWVDTSHYVSQPHTLINYDRNGIIQSFDYLFNTDKKRVTKIVGPCSTNIYTEHTYSQANDLISAKWTDKTVSPTEYAQRTWKYDEYHHVVSESFGYRAAPAYTWRYAWDTQEGLLKQVMDPDGRQTGFGYSTNALLTHRKLFYDATNAYETTFGYTSKGLLCGVTNANGHGIAYTYNGFGSLVSVLPQVGSGFAYEWSALGHLRKVSKTVAPEQATYYDVDELGLVRGITYPDMTSESFAYDAMRRLTNQVDAAGRAMRLTYSPAGHLATVTRLIGDGGSNVAVTVSTEYDNQFNTLAIRDPLGRVAEAYALDIQDRPVAVTNLEGQVMRMNYGLGEFVRSVARFDGSTVSNTFDTGGRLARIQYPDSVSAFTYCGSGLPTMISNACDRIKLAYDLVGRPTNVVVSRGTAPSAVSPISYAYYPDGQISNRVSVAGVESWVLDGADRPVVLAASLPGLPDADFNFSYNGTNNALAEVTCPNELTCSYTYDVMERVTGITWRDASNRVVLGRSYGYSPVGQALYAAAEDGSRAEYTYDELGRLAGERWLDAGGGGLSGALYAYDLAGNRTEKTLLDGSGNTVVTVRYTLGAGDRLASWSVAEPDLVFEDPETVVVTNGLYAYDAAGCLTNAAYIGTEYRCDTALRWDGAYRLVEVRTNGAAVLRNGYDALGRRVWTWDGSETNFFIYDGDHVIAETDATGGLRRAYTRAPGTDRWLAMTVYGGPETAPATYTYLTDRLGTVHALTDESGALVESYAYDAWGRVLAVYDASGTEIPDHKSQIANRHLFQGREYDWATGLYYFRVRWYDPVTGRWLSKDPIGISGGLNQYAFCGNDPVNRTDPQGLCEDGQKYVDAYTDTLMQNPFYLPHILDTMNTMDIWGTSPNGYQYNGSQYRSNEMGNIGAGYASTVAWGPIYAAGAMMAGEALFSDRQSGNRWQDASASFRDNAIGIGNAIHDNPVQTLVPFWGDPLMYPSRVIGASLANWLFRY